MIKRLLCITAFILCITSCCKNNDPEPVNTQHTLFMYLPWSGNSTQSGGSNLLSYFYNNITDIENSIKATGLRAERVLVFISTSPTVATLFEIEYENGKTTRRTLMNYTDPAFTTAEGLTSILRDIVSFAPAERYAMTVGCHGMGWIPVQTGRSRGADQKMHWEYEGGLPTRYFGGTEPQYQTDISTLASAITNAGIGMEYILFDDCYLSTIEVAYELKDVTNHIIACPTEIMAYGMPYDKIGRYLLGDPDYEAIADLFYDFYSKYDYPYGTIGITDCAELDNLAMIMKEINRQYTFDVELRGSIQQMDGYFPTLFFDFGDYVSKLCTDSGMLNRFNAQLQRTVPYKRHTEYYYSSSSGRNKINTYSGTTISDPSINPLAATKTNTAWYKATH